MFIAFAHDDTKLICMEFDRVFVHWMYRVMVHQMYRVLPITCRGLGPSDNRPRQNFVILLRGPHLFLVFLLFSILKHSLLSSFLILVVLSICARSLYEWVCWAVVSSSCLQHLLNWSYFAVFQCLQREHMFISTSDLVHVVFGTLLIIQVFWMSHQKTFLCMSICLSFTNKEIDIRSQH